MSITPDPSSLQRGKILVVDDEIELTNALCEMLSSQGYDPKGFTRGQDALEALQNEDFDVLLADLMMPDIDGITLLKAATEIDPHLVGIIMTGQGTVQTAVDAMKVGATDYILKPFKLGAILSTLSRSLEVRRLRLENVQLREMVNIYELGQVVSYTLDMQVVFQKTAEAALEQCQADEVSILLPDEDEKEFLVVVEQRDGREALVGQKVPVDGTIAGWVAQNFETVSLQGEVNDPRFTPTHPRPDIRSSISMPMVLGNKLVGVLNVNATNKPRKFTQGQIKGLSILVNIAASALENARLYTAIQRELIARSQRERELEAIANVSAALRENSSRGEILEAVMDEVCELMQADAAALGIVDESTGDLIIELGQGEWAQRAGERVPPGKGVAGLVMQTGKPYYQNDIQSDPEIFLPEDRTGNLRAVACAPLIAQESTIGALWIARKSGFSEAEIRLLESISDIGANSILRASLYEQTERQLHRLSALRTIDMAITSSLDLRVTMNILLDEVSTQLEVDAAALLLFNPQTQTLEYSAGRGFRTDFLKRSPDLLHGGLASTAALERKIIQAPDIAFADLEFTERKMLVAEDISACFAAPLIAKGEVEGVLEVFHRTPCIPDREWLEFFESLAGQAAIAIESARLFDNLQRSNQQLVHAYNATIEGWSRALDLRDKETEGHTQRVMEITLRLARAVNDFDENDLIHIRRGALLHDIGKMGVPDEILLKPGILTEDEWVIMRKHPENAYNLLYPITYLRRALDIPYAHHERWDGSGYPKGLKGEEIPLAARIFSIVDVWDALRSDRPYRSGWPDEQVLEYIKDESGKHFDPQIVEIFLQTISQVVHQ